MSWSVGPVSRIHLLAIFGVSTSFPILIVTTLFMFLFCVLSVFFIGVKMDRCVFYDFILQLLLFCLLLDNFSGHSFKRRSEKKNL